MKLGICCNFTYPSCGGSEIVCKAIAESMANTYAMDVTTLGYNVGGDFVHNGVVYKKCLKGNAFLNQINDFDHLFIYSDSFWGFETILNNLDFMKPSLSIALLGMYAMHDNPLLFSIFCDERKQFKVITHSDSYQDYKKCFNNKIPVTVIPNGIDQKEFISASSGFKQKYGINTKHMILNVSNYFYGKGQEHLALIGRGLSEITDDDFTIVQLSNEVKYPHEKTFLNRTKKLFEKENFKYKFLRNLPRKDVLGAFEDSSVTVLPSLKEVAPIVLLESMAAGTPWVAMNVGNTKELTGGKIVKVGYHDAKGYKLFPKLAAWKFAASIKGYLDDTDWAERDGQLGKLMIEKIYNWDTICKQYYNIFID